MDIIQKPSPNYSKNSLYKSLIIIHKTLGAFDGAVSWLRNPSSGVSAHYVISKDGEIVQLVQNDKVAWHAGRISSPSVLAQQVMQRNIWGFINPNRYSIGIEFEAMHGDGWTEKQMAAGAWLIKQFKITTILFHREIAVDKPPMDGWREEILKRLQEPQGSKVEKAVEHLKKATELLES